MDKAIIYQILPRLWGEGKMSSIDIPSLDYFKSLSVTHVWYTGIIRHSTGLPFTKGNPGSPYAIADYYDVNPYLADNEAERMAEFESLVQRTHAAGLKVVLDFVPNHVGRDYGRSRVRTDLPYLGDGDDTSVHWRAENDFFYYPGEALRLPDGLRYDEYPAKATGNNYTPAPERNDWYDTIKLNYCPYHTPTWDKMLQVLLFWVGKGVDAFRCDMVELVPREFFVWAIEKVKAKYPDCKFIAEVYQKNNYKLWTDAGFDWLYDKSGLYDSLKAILCQSASTQEITRNWQSLGALQPRMLHFLENHDEQRFASPFFGRTPERSFAPLGASLLFCSAPFLLYFGEEIGEAAAEAADGRTTIFQFARIPSLQRLATYAQSGSGLRPEESAILERFRTLLRRSCEPLFAEGDTYDLGYCNTRSEGFDPDRHFAFLRSQAGQTVLVFCNFSSAPAHATLVIPEHAALFGVRPGTLRVQTGPFDTSITEYR